MCLNENCILFVNLLSWLLFVPTSRRRARALFSQSNWDQQTIVRDTECHWISSVNRECQCIAFAIALSTDFLPLYHNRMWAVLFVERIIHRSHIHHMNDDASVVKNWEKTLSTQKTTTTSIDSECVVRACVCVCVCMSEIEIEITWQTAQKHTI